MKLEGDPYGLRPTGSALSNEVGLSPCLPLKTIALFRFYLMLRYTYLYIPVFVLIYTALYTWDVREEQSF